MSNCVSLKITSRSLLHNELCHQMSDFKAKMHQNRFRLGSTPDPAGGAYSAPPDSLAGFKGRTSKGREGRGRKEGQGGEGRDQEKGKGREGERGTGMGGKFRGKGRERDREKGREGKI